MEHIKRNVVEILNEIEGKAQLVAAAKTRSLEEVESSIEAGVKIIGENYVQEGETLFPVIGNKVKWHFIGHLQTNKVKKAVKIFDMVETVDSIKLAKEISKQCEKLGKVMEILIEVNSGREEQKAGVFPENVESLIKEMVDLKNIKIVGLMTMGPFSDDPEDARPYFIETKKIFDKLKEINIENIEMRFLSMGMTSSYRIAIEEGANLVRIGTKIYGNRNYK